LDLFDYSTDIGQRNVRHGRPSDGTLRTKGCLGRMPEAGRSRKHVLQPGPQWPGFFCFAYSDPAELWLAA